MKRKICVIDDSIPASEYSDFINETEILDQAILKFLCERHSSWSEDTLRQLFSQLFSYPNWGISGFLNPDFYFNYVEHDVYSPEVIIFDWDYSVKSASTEEHLLRILQSTYSIVAIYTGADKREEIEEILNQVSFVPYRDQRLKLVEKGEHDSVSKLLYEIETRFEENFSFKFGQELKFHAAKALNSILVNIGEMSFNQFIWTFGHESTDGKRSISVNEFVEILSEKFKNNLSNVYSPEEVFESDAHPNESSELVRKLWAYRLYKSPNDDLVRVGDIISKVNGDWCEKFLVISSDCHMNQFWKKNLGSLTLIPLFANVKESEVFKTRLLISKKRGDCRGIKATSLTNLSGFEALTLLTSIPYRDENANDMFIDYIAFPRSIFSVNIPPPAGLDESKIRVQALRYSHISDYTGEGRLNLNEPFRSPLIQYCINTITGYGVPDYPQDLQNSISDSFDENFKA